ncbi:hypothetical protein HXX76_003100 [Chlamydomonas incerta]|uniref:Uncharacterized protein n=1 Tax=Chlamydomonas incerta TaxID=51695 RepID=A0A835W8H5_CHLIN|nr:hypothetical protein HXX76_003100 [Chlamydomonas incerta]|eukprot:KAG2441478.1 hypothetical protein HXX76_003100 [Chlamydomonas incerta]
MLDVEQVLGIEQDPGKYEKSLVLVAEVVCCVAAKGINVQEPTPQLGSIAQRAATASDRGQKSAAIETPP